MELIASKSDSSMFVYNEKSITVVILIYVDDILVVGNCLQRIQEFISALNKLFALKDLGDLSFFLGVEVQRSAGSLHHSQTKYINDLLKKVDILLCKPVAIPMAAGTVLSLFDGPLFEDATKNRSIVGALQYCTLTRPDLSFVVNKVC